MKKKKVTKSSMGQGLTKRERRGENQQVEKAPVGRGKKLLFAMVFYSIFVVLLIGIEVSLRSAGYGIDTRPFVHAKYKPEIWIENLEINEKYFPQQSKTNSNNRVHAVLRNTFPVEKSPHTLRGFFIGESSVQGFPFDSNHSFSKITEAALERGGKYKNVEILNLGVSAMTSYYIKDVALKALKYQPDFILIYAGHNEYYGNVSYTTGGNYFTKNLYLFLKEFRSFQWLFNALQRKTDEDKSETLMEKQFNNYRVPMSDRVDQRVADDFIRNMDLIIQTYARRRIPIIIVEPVCNLLDMPPFAGENDEDFKEFIQAYQRIVESGDRVRLKEYYDERMELDQYNRNANVKYLDALTRSYLQDRPDIQGFIEAKDLDTVPFRVRSKLVNALRTYSIKQSHRFEDIHYIPLSDLLTEKYGEGVLGNRIFIDQLHFNQRGHRVVSRIIAEKLSEIFEFEQAQKESVDAFFTDDARIDEAIYYLPAYKVASSSAIDNLVNAPPFTEMLLEYRYDPSDRFIPQNAIENGMVNLLQKLFAESRSFSVKNEYLVNYYLERNDFQAANQYVEAYSHVYPGSYKTYLLKARFAQLEGDVEKAKENFIMAYLLSEKMPEIHREMKDYFTGIQRSLLFRQIEEEYGKPITK